VLLLAGLSTGHKIGLAVVAVVFIAFALASTFLGPRWRPDFPGKAGMGPYVIACFVLFAAMITAVEVFGAESEEASASESGGAAQVVPVREKEFEIVVARKELRPGRTTFVVSDVGKLQHDLSVEGPGVNGKKTALIDPGAKASLTVTLAKGKYTLWCSVPGHRQAGMVATVSVA
jgi:plastocyanin